MGAGYLRFESALGLRHVQIPTERIKRFWFITFDMFGFDNETDKPWSSIEWYRCQRAKMLTSSMFVAPSRAVARAVGAWGQDADGTTSTVYYCTA